MYSLLDQRRWRIFFITLLLLVPLVVFFRVQQFDFVNWDDDLHVYHNSSIRTLNLANAALWFRAPVVSMYVPLPLLSFALDYQLYGQDAGGYHRTNLILHLINVLLVFALFNHFFRDPLMTAAGALIFALHPIQVETVAWISERKNLLFALFFLSGFLFWVRTEDRPPGLQKKYAAAALALFAGALLSKITAVVIPVILLAYDHCWQANLSRRKILFYAAFLVPAVAAAGLILRLYPRSVALLFERDLVSHLLGQIADFCAYLKHMIYPVHLRLVYPKENYPFGQGFDALAWLCVVSVLIGALIQALIRRHRYGFWLLWFLGFLAPVVTVFHVPVGDRHAYLPLVGLIGLFLFLFQKKELILLPVLISAVLVLGGISYLHLDIWQNSETVWQHVLRQEPDNLQATMKLALHCETHGETAKAAALYEKILEEHKSNLPYPYINLYSLYLRTGQKNEADRVSDLFREAYPMAPTMDSVYKTLLSLKRRPREAHDFLVKIARPEKTNAGS